MDRRRALRIRFLCSGPFQRILRRDCTLVPLKPDHFSISSYISLFYSDWWGIYPFSDNPVFDATSVIYWEYLNSESKRNGDAPNLAGNASLVASLPAQLIVGLFYNDAYEPFGTFPFVFRNWTECRDFSSCADADRSFFPLTLLTNCRFT